MSNSLDRDQARHSVGPDLGPNCLQRLSSDDKIRFKEIRSILYRPRKYRTCHKQNLKLTLILLIFLYRKCRLLIMSASYI